MGTDATAHDIGEFERLKALDRFGILDTPAEPQFDRIVSMASRMLGMPISLISLIDRDRQWFKARIGLEATQTPRTMAFCAHAIKSDAVMVVEDATGDERFADNPLVTSEPSIRFYAGAPLIARDGERLGTLCVIDQAPRQLTAKEQDFLTDLAAIVMDELELRLANQELAVLARTDPLTGTCNRRTFFNLAEREMGRRTRLGQDIVVVLLDIDHFKLVNDRHGHAVGDKVLVEVARRMGDAIRVQDVLARLGGEEFGILLPDTSLAQGVELAERLRQLTATEPFDASGAPLPVTISLGVAAVASGECNIDDAMRRADAALYRAKHGGRNQVASGG